MIQNLGKALLGCTARPRRCAVDALKHTYGSTFKCSMPDLRYVAGPSQKRAGVETRPYL